MPPHRIKYSRKKRPEHYQKIAAKKAASTAVKAERGKDRGVISESSSAKALRKAQDAVARARKARAPLAEREKLREDLKAAGEKFRLRNGFQAKPSKPALQSLAAGPDRVATPPPAPSPAPEGEKSDEGGK